MKNLFLAIFISTFAYSAFAFASASLPCKGCSELKKIEAEYRAKPKADIKEYDQLLGKTIAVVETMPADKSLKLSPDQVKAVVAVMRQAIPKDPADGLLMGNYSIFVANRDAIDAEVAKLPKAEAQLLQQSMNIQLGQSQSQSKSNSK
jgi:hypothetical protein